MTNGICPHCGKVIRYKVDAKIHMELVHGIFIYPNYHHMSIEKILNYKVGI
jgi:uncharacterized C2H2 Zn-finger protein